MLGYFDVPCLWSSEEMRRVEVIVHERYRIGQSAPGRPSRVASISVFNGSEKRVQIKKQAPPARLSWANDLR